MEEEQKRKGRKRATEIDAYAGARIRHFRTMRGLSRQAVGKTLGFSQQQIQKYESGEDRVNLSFIWGLSRLFNLSPIEFFPETGRTETTTPPSLAAGKVIDFFSGFEDREILAVLRALSLIWKKGESRRSFLS